MTALALIPLAAIALALLYQPKRPERIGYVERTARDFWRGERIGVKCLRLELIDESQQAAA